MASGVKSDWNKRVVKMRDFLEQIQTALDSGLYYLALFASLGVPDICGAIGSNDGKATKGKYIEWFDKYVAHKYSACVGVAHERIEFLTGEDCYRFRCLLLHQGSSQLGRYSRVIFVEPSVTTIVAHCNVLHDALNLHVRIFCADILSGAEDWLQEYEGTELYKKNYGKFMQRYPEGLAPYIVGVPVIS